MNSKLVLLVCGLLAGVAAKDYPGYYGQFESTYEASKILTVGSESCTVEQLSSSTDASTTTDNSESNEKDDLIVCECPLTEYLYNISVVLKDTPYGEYFYQWFYEIQMEILADQSYSNEEKFAAVMSSLKSLCNEYPGMEDAISYIKLEGFGYVKDMFSAKAAIQCQSPEASQLLVLNGDSCKLFDAFLNDTSLSSEQLSALKTLFNEIKSSVLNGQYTSTDESILVFKHFHNFFKKHQGWESAFYNISIEGFGTFGDWQKCGETNYNLWTMSIQIGGDAASTPVLEAILAFANNASIDIGLRLQIKNFYNALLAKWETTTDEDTRLQMLMELVAQFSALEGFNLQALLDIEYSFEFEGIESSQSLYDLLYQAYYKYKFGFSSQLSLVSSTSSAPISTTTGYLLVCDASYMALLTTNDPALNNQSPIVYSMWQTYYSNVWSTTCKNSLKAVITRCNTYITSFSSNGSTSQQKANAIFNYLAANPTNNPQCQQDILKVVIKTSSGESWGRVCDFATCTKQTGSNLACSS